MFKSRNDGTDTDGRAAKKRSFNVLDGIIIALVLIVAAAAVYIMFFRGGNDTSGEAQRITYTVQIIKVRDELVDKIGVGDNVTDAVTKYPIGRVVAVSHEPAQAENNDYNSGGVKLTTYPEHSDIYITVEAYARQNDRGFYVNDYRLVIGSAVYLRLRNFTGSGFCTSITVE